MSSVNFNTINRGALSGLTDSLGLSSSAQASQAAYDQIQDPNKAAYVNPGADPALAGYSSMTDGSNPMLAASRGAQTDALGLSRGLADGSGPSLSRANMNLGLSQGTANLSSAAAGMGGGAQGGLGQRNLLQAIAGMQGGVAGQAGVAGATEQANAIKNYGALGSTIRQQDQGQLATGYGGMLGAGDAIRAGNVGYDSALQNAGDKRAAAIRGFSTSAQQGSQQVINMGANIAKAAAGAMPSFGGGGADPRESDADYAGAYHDPYNTGTGGF